MYTQSGALHVICRGHCSMCIILIFITAWHWKKKSAAVRGGRCCATLFKGKWGEEKKSPPLKTFSKNLRLLFLALLETTFILDSMLLASVDQAQRRLSNWKFNTGTHCLFFLGERNGLMAFPYWRFAELACWVCGLWLLRVKRETRDYIYYITPLVLS